MEAKAKDSPATHLRYLRQLQVATAIYLNGQFKLAVERLARGLLARGFRSGDRTALIIHSLTEGIENLPCGTVSDTQTSSLLPQESDKSV